MMNNGLIIFIYSIMTYGISNMFVFGSGSFKIFEHLRNFTDNIGEHFGSLFKCMMCFPANLGLFLSIINWFLISVPFTPFNLLLCNSNLWWLAAILDCGFTSGIVWLIHHFEEFFENLAEGNKQELIENNYTDEIDEDIIIADDITLQNENKTT